MTPSLTGTSNPQTEGRARTLLHIGCGPKRLRDLPSFFQTGWREVRLDIDPKTKPDIIASLTDLGDVGSGSVDAIWSSHNIEHLFQHEARKAAAEFRRVLKDDGWAIVTCPDIRGAMQHAVAHGLDSTLYMSPRGPITPRDVLFGHQPSIRQGNAYMAHRNGFDLKSLLATFEKRGFRKLYGERHEQFLWMVAGQFEDTPAARAHLRHVLRRKAR